jgi:hypothetical protein
MIVPVNTEVVLLTGNFRGNFFLFVLPSLTRLFSGDGALRRIVAKKRSRVWDMYFRAHARSGDTINSGISSLVSKYRLVLLSLLGPRLPSLRVF